MACIFFLCANAESRCPSGREIKGTVLDVFVGEVDNEHIGSACITFFKNNFYGKYQKTAIVENILDCSLADRLLDRTGKTASVCLIKLKRYKSKEEIKALHDFVEGTYYLYDPYTP